MYIETANLDSSGVNYSVFEYEPLKHGSSESFLFHLMYHEGPLCSVFDHSDTHVSILDWLSSQPELGGHRWAKFIVEKETLSKFIYGAIDFREMLLAEQNAALYFDIILGKDGVEISSKEHLISELLNDASYGSYKYDPNYTIDDDIAKAWMLTNSQLFKKDISYFRRAISYLRFNYYEIKDAITAHFVRGRK